MEKTKTDFYSRAQVLLTISFFLLLSIVLLFCIAITGSLSAQTITIGSGTNTQSYPFNSFYGYGRSASLFSSTEISSYGTITSLGWYVGTAQSTSVPVKIYLKETTSTTLTANTWANLTASATLVYDGAVSFTPTGWFTIDITDYNYAANNLMVLCEANYGGAGTSSYPLFRYTNSASKHMYFAADNTPPTVNGTVNGNRPNIRISIVTCSMIGGTATATDNTINVGESTAISCTGHTTIGSDLQWEQSLDGSTGWANVTGGSGATTDTYTTPNLSVTTYYRLKVTQSTDVSCFDYSTTAEVTVVCGVNGGTATAVDTDIYMGDATEVSCAGYTSTGTSLYWQQSLNGTTAWADVTDGSGETSSTYTTGILAQTTYFRLSVDDGVCTSYSNSVCITTTCAVTTGGTATPVSSSIPMGETTIIDGTGFSVRATDFQWQQSATGTGSWFNVIGGTGANTSSYNTPALISTTYFRLIVTDGYCSAYSSVAQVQTTLSNDECSGAIVLTVGDACSFVTVNNTGATASSGIPAAGCGGSVFVDTWFKFVVPASGHIEINTQAGTLNDVAMALYSGTCGSLSLIECDDDDGDAVMSLINRSGLTAGDTLYLRIWDWGGNNFGSFGICVSIPAPIAADECADAAVLPVSPVCEYLVFDYSAATASVGVSDPTCGTSNDYYDVWFQCEIPISGNIRISSEIIVGSALTDCAIAVYSGTCGSLTQIACNDDWVPGMESMPMQDVVDRTPGETVYIRFWDIVTTGKSTSLDRGVCKVCVFELPDLIDCVAAIVPEDLCIDAPVIVSLDGYCGNTSATYSPESPGNLASLFCGSIENNSWLSFVASDVKAQLNVYVSDCYSTTHSWSYPTSGIQMQVYGTSDCLSFSAYSECWFPGEPVNGFLTASGLTPGNTYYLMIDGVYGDNCDYKIGAAKGSISLPVEFLSVDAECKGDRIQVLWETATEKNCESYSIEKSFDGKNFVSIMSMPGSGTKLTKSLYIYDDYDLSENKFYYRIKQIDYDGKYSYSNIFTANCLEYFKSNISIYPNPFTDSFCVDYSSYSAVPTKMEICEITGGLLISRLVSLSDDKKECFEMSNDCLSGYYLIKIYFDSDIQILKLVKI
jgi:hypothetical protein